MNKELQELMNIQLEKFHKKTNYQNICHEDAMFQFMFSEEFIPIARFISKNAVENALIFKKAFSKPEVHGGVIFNEREFKNLMGVEDGK